MIRRDWPLGAVTPDRWVLISQVEHARLSGVLARAWGGPNVPPLFCPADDALHPLAGARREFLAAVDHHDDGWLGYSDTPAIDPDAGRPYSFTEMPTDVSQRIWSDSIDVCREVGPLAGWVVASHFSWLQSKRDDDFHLWVDWLAEVDSRRVAWLAEWLALSEHHTPELADRCLLWLQTLDWMSLWLCCRCPALPGDRPPMEPLTIGADETGWPRVEFAATAGEGGIVLAAPWCFGSASVELLADASEIPQGRYAAGEVEGACRSTRLTWRIQSR